MKQIHELAQDYATVLRKIAAVEVNRSRITINVHGIENWGDAAVEIRDRLQPHLPPIIDAVLQKAREDAALLKQQLDAAARESGNLKVVK